VARAWVDYVPKLVRTGVHNFFSNLDDILVSANNLLQGKVYEGASDFMRVVINTTFGLGGLFDVATDARLEKHNEDLGQTLAVWGVPDGPYLVLPILGPSTLRDGPASLASVYAHPLAPAAREVDPAHWRGPYNGGVGLYFTDMRAGALEVGSLMDVAALDRYRFMRDAWLQRRHSLIHDGNVLPAPPPEDDEDDLPPGGAVAPGAAPGQGVPPGAGPAVTQVVDTNRAGAGEADGLARLAALRDNRGADQTNPENRP
jgi:phospholipid-binding lipoprotein MlaA